MTEKKLRFGADGDINSLSKADVLAHFDACIDAGVIKFDRDFVTKLHTVDDIDVSLSSLSHIPLDFFEADSKSQFEFRISEALTSKPHFTGAPLASALNINSVPRPGSDLTTAGTDIAALGSTHFLAYNGFSCYHPHYLLLTNDGYRRQWEPLDEDDFAAVHMLLDSQIVGDKAGRGEYLVFFNGGADAGCSRVHKHLQAIPQESYDGDPWRNVDKGVLPFGYFEKRFDLTAAFEPKMTLEAYGEGLEFVERSLGVATAEEDGKRRAPAHSVLLDRERIVVIPRVAAGLGGVGANAAGMLGMIWVQSEDSMEKWLEIGPQNVLREAGVRKS